MVISLAHRTFSGGFGNAPAVEKLTQKLEQDRQRAERAYEKKKVEQNQPTSHVRNGNDLDMDTSAESRKAAYSPDSADGERGARWTTRAASMWGAPSWSRCSTVFSLIWDTWFPISGCVRRSGASRRLGPTGTCYDNTVMSASLPKATKLLCGTK
jgi:hypothetical protein